MNKISNYVLNLFFFLIIFDFSGDPIIRSYDLNLINFEFYYKLILSFLFLFLLIFNFKLKFNKSKIYIPYLLICFIFIYGFIVGIVNNNILNALNELSGYFFILLIPVIVNLEEKFNGINTNYDQRVIKFIKISTYIIIFKIFFYEIATLIVYGIPSYKILLKQTPLFLISFSILLEKMLRKEKGYNFLFLLTCFILLVAIARMIYISMIFLFLIHFIRNFSINKIKIQIRILLIIFISFLLYINIQSLDYTGTFDRIYGGEVYEEGVDYRITQFYVILKRFYEFPLGAGFGYYTPDYLSYSELSKPYLLELDLFNFFSKIGLIFSLVYLINIFNIYFYVNKAIYKNYNSLFAFYFGIISLLIYSLGQTAHQGYLYWVTFSIFYSSLIITYNSKNRFSHAILTKK